MKKQKTIAVVIDPDWPLKRHHELIGGIEDYACSSIDLDYKAIGRRAAELLDGLMRGEPPPQEPIRIAPAFLEVRESSDAFAVDDPVVSRALRFIAEHSHQPIKPADVAQAVHTSLRNLQRYFEKEGDRSIGGTITYFRIEHAKRLLVQTDQPVKYLCVEAGFDNPHQMYQIFMREEGLSPTTFRQEHRNRTG